MFSWPRIPELGWVFRCALFTRWCPNLSSASASAIEIDSTIVLKVHYVSRLLLSIHVGFV